MYAARDVTSTVACLPLIVGKEVCRIINQLIHA